MHLKSTYKIKIQRGSVDCPHHTDYLHQRSAPRRKQDLFSSAPTACCRHVPAGAEVAAAAVFHHGEAGGRVRSTASPPPPRAARPQQQHPGGADADGGGPSTIRSQPKAQRCAPRPAPAPRCLPACPSLPCRSCPLCPPSAQERAWGPRQLRRIPAHR